MRLGIRIFLVYFLFVGLAGYFLLNTVREQIRPVVRQSSEETLVDTANLLADVLDNPRDEAHIAAVRAKVNALTSRFPVYR